MRTLSTILAATAIVFALNATADATMLEIPNSEYSTLPEGGVAALSTPWQVTLDVYREGEDYISLHFGMETDATDAFDTGKDIYAPPPGPLGEDAKFYMTIPDYLGLNTDKRGLSAYAYWWLYISVPGNETWTISWDSGEFPQGLLTIDEADASFNPLGNPIDMMDSPWSLTLDGGLFGTSFKYVIEYTSVIPEPISIIFFGTGLIGVFGFVARRKTRKARMTGSELPNSGATAFSRENDR